MDSLGIARKRKHLHLNEDRSPERPPHQLPPPLTSSSSSYHRQSASGGEEEDYEDDEDRDNEQDYEPGPSSSRHNNHRSNHTNDRSMPRDNSPPSATRTGSAPLELPSSGLNRGFACLGCRRRKSKCDTNRPSCDQCAKARMPCVYDDRPQKRPTEVLKERIRDLEEKVRQLEQQNPGLAAALAKQQQGSQSGSPPRLGTTPPAGPSTSTAPAPSSRGGGAPGYPPFEQQQQQQGWSNPYPHSDIRSTAHPQLDPYGGFPSNPSGGGGGSGQVIPGMNQFMLGAAQAHAQNLRAMDPSMFAVAPDTSNDPLPPDLDPNELLNSFIAHRHQAYCDLSITRFTQSLSASTQAPPASTNTLSSGSSSSSSTSHSHPNSPHPPTTPSHTQSHLQPPHASLLNAIYLLGAFFSASPHLSTHEPLLLHRARQGIAAALENAERLENAVQAASLVAIYLYAKGRVLEGYYLACANARFAMGCGMHKIANPTFVPGGASGGGAGGAAGKSPVNAQGGEDEELNAANQMPLLEVPKDPIELGERIHIWWQVWMVDQCGAISTNLPPALSDTIDPLSRIDTCFPPEIAEFEPGGALSHPQHSHAAFSHAYPSMVGGGAEWETLRSLYDPTVDTMMDGEADGPSRLGRSAMVAKSIELFSRAWKLSKHDLKDDHFRRAFDATDVAVRRFSATLPRSTDAFGGVSHALFLPHSLALAAIIQLHWIVAIEHNHLHPSYQNCLNAAIDMVAIIDVIQPHDYPLLELHIGTCWKLTADVLYREYNRLRGVDNTEARLYHEALEKVQEATRQLSSVFPVLMELWRVSNP